MQTSGQGKEEGITAGAIDAICSATSIASQGNVAWHLTSQKHLFGCSDSTLPRAGRVKREMAVTEPLKAEKLRLARSGL